MGGSAKKNAKTSIFGHLGQKGPFWTVLAKMAKTVKIIKKALGTFTSSKDKVSEKSNERFPIKSVTAIRANGFKRPLFRRPKTMGTIDF